MVRVMQSHTVALYCLHHFLYRLVLGYHFLLQSASHVPQPFAFALSHPLHWYASHHSHHVSHIVSCHILSVASTAFCPAASVLSQLVFQLLLLVAETCCQFEVLVLHCLQFLVLHLLYLVFQRRYVNRYVGMVQVYSGSHLVQGVDSLVREGTVSDVALCQFDTCMQCIL